MGAGLDNLKREVAETKTALASAKLFIKGLADRLKAILGQPNNEAELQALADELDAEQTALAQAITDNTVAEGEPTPPPDPGGEV